MVNFSGFNMTISTTFTVARESGIIIIKSENMKTMLFNTKRSLPVPKQFYGKLFKVSLHVGQYQTV